MKKNNLRAAIVAAVMLVIYHLVAFLIPFERTEIFWISYGFTLAAFAVSFISIYVSFVNAPDARSKFYGFPIARIGAIYGIAQLIVSLVVMALGYWIPSWIALLVYAFAPLLIGLFATAFLALSAMLVIRLMRISKPLHIALVCGVTGLALSYYLNTSAGAAVVLCCAAVYFATLPLRRK